MGIFSIGVLVAFYLKVANFVSNVNPLRKYGGYPKFTKGSRDQGYPHFLSWYDNEFKSNLPNIEGRTI